MSAPSLLGSSDDSHEAWNCFVEKLFWVVSNNPIQCAASTPYGTEVSKG